MDRQPCDQIVSVSLDTHEHRQLDFAIGSLHREQMCHKRVTIESITGHQFSVESVGTGGRELGAQDVLVA